MKPGAEVVAAHFANPCTEKEFTVQVHHFIRESGGGGADLRFWRAGRGLFGVCDGFFGSIDGTQFYHAGRGRQVPISFVT